MTFFDRAGGPAEIGRFGSQSDVERLERAIQNRGPWETTVANSGKHELVMTRTGEYFDVCGGDRRLVCSKRGRDGAISAWHKVIGGGIA